MLPDPNKEAGQTNPSTRKSARPLLDPVRVLVTCGWLSAAEAADPNLRVESLTRSHQVVRVTAPDGRAVILKQPTPDARQSGRGLQRELYVYRLAGWMEALSQILPSPVLIDEAHQLLVCESLALGGSWPNELVVEPLSAPELAKQLGRTMASWHAETSEIAMEPSPAAGILYITESLEPALEGRSSSSQAFLRSLAAEPEFIQALREGAEVYQPACLIHGDIRPDNWAVKRDQGIPTLKVFDWEMAGFGDPAWDVGSACTEAILQLIRSGTSPTPDASGWPSEAGPMLRDFICAYATSRDVEEPVNPAIWERVPLLGAARLLHVAVEWAEYSYNIDNGGVDQIVGQARNLLHARQQAAASLAGWARS